MALDPKNKNVPVLIGLGLLCVLIAIAYAYVEYHLSWNSLLICIVGLLSIFVSVWVLQRQAQRHARSNAQRKCLIIVLVTLLFAAALVSVNYIAHLFDRRWDLTENKQHTLEDETLVLLSEMEEEVKFVAFYVGLPPKYLEDLFRAYEENSRGMIKGEIIDPLVNIGYAASFESSISNKERKVIVESAAERRNIDFTYKALTEDLLNNAIVRVTREQRIACFSAGHGERDVDNSDPDGYTSFNKNLIANNILAKEIVIGLTGEIPGDCDVLIIAGAKTQLQPIEEELIQEYLRKGGDALILIENTLVTTEDKPLKEEEVDLYPSLNGILNQWGMTINQDIVVDLSSHASGDVGSPATKNYLAHKAIVSGLDYTFFIRPRSISIRSDRPRSVRIAPLILTMSGQSSWGETNRNLEVKYQEGEDNAGPVSIAFVAFEPKEEGKDSDTRLIVITDADFLSNAYLGQYSNVLLGLNSLNWLTESDYTVYTDEKDIEVEQLDLTSKQKRIIIMVLVAMPLLISIMGIMVWLKGKK